MLFHSMKSLYPLLFQTNRTRNLLTLIPFTSSHTYNIHAVIAPILILFITALRTRIFDPQFLVSNAMDSYGDHRLHRRPASHFMVILAHVFGVLAIVLMLVWLLHYREGIDLDSDNPFRVFNVHPFLMLFGFIFLAGEAMMAYKTVRAERQVKKLSHMVIHLVAICLGIVGLSAVFKFHDKMNIRDMYSLHSWIGIGTFSLFCLQWLFGLMMFLFPRAPEEARARAVPWHVNFGRILLIMAVCTAETGLMEKVTFLGLTHNGEARLINFLGLAILLFGIVVDLTVSLPRFT